MSSFKLFPNEKIQYGPASFVDKRKEARPFSPKCSMLLTIKADRAVFELLKKEIIIFQEKYAKKWNIRIYDFALNWDHMHSLVQARDRSSYNNYIRNLTSAISRRSGVKGLFPDRPHTRLIKWGRDFEQAKKYMELNRTEAQGFSKIQARKILANCELSESLGQV